MVRSVLKALVERICQLERRVEEQAAQLRRKSRNSSQPPSSDPIGQKRRQKEPTGRKRGAQPGHPRHERQFVPLEKVAGVRPVRPDSCPCCGEGLQGVEPNPNPERHQVTEISRPEARTTEYRVYSVVCPRCGHIVVGELPAEARRPFGPRLTATVAHLKVVYRLSLRQIQRLLEEWFGVRMSLGQVFACVTEPAGALAEPYEEIGQEVRLAPVVHADETSWRVEQKGTWLWVAVTDKVTYYLIRRSRLQAVAKELLGPETRAIVHTDRYSAYGWLDRHRRQLCLAHVQRQAKAMLEREGKSARIGALLRKNLDFVFFQHARMCRGEITRTTMRDSILKHARWWIRELLQQGARLKCPKTAATCRFLLRREPSLWVFLDHEGVEPTNDIAERALRSPVIWRKISFGNDTQSGARCTERLLSIAETCRQIGRCIRTFLTEALLAYRQGRQPPRFLPEPAT